MILSFNIPTYNRASYLKKNVEQIIYQIRLFNLQSEVEINISDNASTDNTEIVCKRIIDNNSDIIIRYSRNENNLGPDINYIKTMFMAHGDYSILWGDDDFLKKDSLKFILDEILNSNCNFFISNRTNIDRQGNYLDEQNFLDFRIESRFFNFSNIDEGRLYLALCVSLGGCFTFISSIIYRTSILNEIGAYDERFTGTFYSFHWYWWQWILKGNRIKYLNTSYLLCTTKGKANSETFGVGLDRTLVDFEGFLIVADTLFANTPYYQDFLNVVLREYSFEALLMRYFKEPMKFKKRIIPLLYKYGYDDKKINLLIEFGSITRNVKNIIHAIVNHNM